MRSLPFAAAVLAGSLGLARGQEPPHPPGPGDLPPPSPAEVERIIDELKKEEPGLGEELSRARREHPDKFAEHARGFAPMLMDPDARETLKRNMKADFAARRAMQAYREAKGPEEKKRLEPELRKALESQFDAKLAAHELHLKHMTDELARLKTRIENRRKLRAKLIDKKLAEFNGDEESWDW